ncbi:MAG: nucleoside 2-deoxyribosyltransferase [Chitinophagaceae bacterium]|nr:nucleoside 2-deoxyribosyltransferase [Chitinophagaceae bacterium]
MNEISNISMLLIALVSGIIATIAFLFYNRLKKSKYDSDQNKAVLESIRNSIEKQIYNLNDRLILNEERWRDVNHLLLRNEYKENNTPITNSRQTYYSDFLKANGITQNDLLIDKRLVFILTPFHDYYSEDYKVIRDACSEGGFNAYRGDENYIKGDIFPEMLKLIVKANLIIANVNGRNPNVLYELGIAQALDKPVILISSEPDKLPIDIKSKRFLVYRNYKELQEMIRKELQNLL